MSFLLHIFSPWCWRMAWRDSRRTRLRLLLFSASIMAGIAALVLVGSLRDSLLRALDGEARAMLGADAYLHAKRPLSDKAEELLRGQPCQILRETAFTAMVRAAGREDAKLVQARSVEEGWPHFGEPTTAPADAWERCLAGEGFVMDTVLEESLAVRVGDRLKLGDLELPVLGVLRRPPPQVSFMSAVAPELFFAHRLAVQAKLDEDATGTFHRRWLVFTDGYDVEKEFADKLKKELRTEGVNIETVAARKRSIAFALNIVNSFLSLMAFIALVLGGLGVASAIHVHATERLPVVATLRCLGCTPGRAMAVYVIQGIWLGLAGAAGGVLLGAAAVHGAAALLNGLLPVPVEAQVSGRVAAQAMGFGFVLCVSFALLPLLNVRRVPALAAVRAPVTGGVSLWRDPVTWGVLLLVAGGLVWLAVMLSPPRREEIGLGFCVALALGMLLLAGAAKLVMWLARKIVRPGWPFTLRMGLAGLHRPRNQTMLFLLSVGTGVSMVLSTLLAESMLTSYLNSWDVRMKANFFAINIAPDQRETAAAALQRADAQLLGQAPVAVASLQSINGKSLNEIQDLKGRRRVGGWFLTHIYRISWDPSLPEAEAGQALKITMQKPLAEELRVKPGDRVGFSHNGLTLDCEVTDLHEADIERMLDNFPVLIKERVPSGLIVTYAAAARIRDAAHGVRAQRELTAALPGVTIFDIASISVIVEKLISRGAKVVHWLSLLTVITGLVIVAAVLLSGRRDRAEESVLLRTLGASRAQIRRILVTEYLLLGLFAAITGAVLSLGFAWLLAWKVFEIPFNTWHWPLFAAVALVSALTAALGMALSRGIAGHPPLAILRGES
jgi:putative ABC transport system permease protein